MQKLIGNAGKWKVYIQQLVKQQRFLKKQKK
jgi:hypothetical protein